MKFRFDKASEISDDDIAKFKKMVLDEGEVRKETFDGLIDRDPIIFVFPNFENIQVCGALKIPNDDYKKRKLEKLSDSSEIKYELGWIVVHKDHRKKGLGSSLVEATIDYSEKMYSTVRSDNEGMIHILEKYEFQLLDETKSTRGNYSIKTFTRQ